MRAVAPVFSERFWQVALDNETGLYGRDLCGLWIVPGGGAMREEDPKISDPSTLHENPG
jgi:hypothetical protein